MTGAGQPLSPRGQMPQGFAPYRTIGPFDAASLPAGLRAEHRLKPGAWALLSLTEGALRFEWDDDAGGALDLVAPATLVVPEQVPHHVEGAGPFTVTIAFHRA